jgi:hypothetical protein
MMKISLKIITTQEENYASVPNLFASNPRERLIFNIDILWNSPSEQQQDLDLFLLLYRQPL